MTGEATWCSGSLTQNRLFRRLWASQFMAVTAMYALNFAALVVVAERTLSVTQTGLVILSSITPAFLGSLLGGVLVDRSDRVHVLKTSHLVRAGASVTFWLVVVVLSDVAGLSAVYAVLIVGAFVTQFATPAELSMLPDIVRGDELIRANSLLQTSTLVAEGFGIVLIGPLLSKIAGAGTVGLACTALLLLSFALVFPLPGAKSGVSNHGRATTLRGIELELRAGWATIVQDRVLSLVTIQVTLASILLLILLSILPALAAVHLGVQLTNISFLMIPGGIGFGAGALLVGKMGDRMASQRWISGGLITLGCAIILMVLLSEGEGLVYLWLLLGAIGALGLALAFAIIPARAVIQRRPAPAMRGRVIAAQLALANALAVIPLLLGGAAADLIGVQPVMLVLALLALGSGAAGWHQTQS